MDVYKEVYTITSSGLNLGDWSEIKLTIDAVPDHDDTLELKIAGVSRVKFTFKDSRDQGTAAASWDQRQPHPAYAKNSSAATRTIYRGSDRDELTKNQIASNIAGAFYNDPSLTSIGFGDHTHETVSITVSDNVLIFYRNEKKAGNLALDIVGGWATASGGSGGATPVGFYKLGSSDDLQPMNAVLGNGSSTEYIIAKSTVNTVNVGPPVQKFDTITLNLASGIIHPIRTYGANKTVTVLR